jgi:hypothetical protein
MMVTFRVWKHPESGWDFPNKRELVCVNIEKALVANLPMPYFLPLK